MLLLNLETTPTAVLQFYYTITGARAQYGYKCQDQTSVDVGEFVTLKRDVKVYHTNKFNIYELFEENAYRIDRTYLKIVISF